MNILWIEDFGGNLSTGTDTLNLLFKDLINFDGWDEDLYSLLERPSDLKEYCQKSKAQHCIYLCRHFYDYQAIKNNINLIQKIDAIIIDIRLDNKVDFNMPIPEWTGDMSKFHSEAGFYIFNDLVHLGFPSEKICLMTGESGKLDAFDKRRAEIYFPKVASFTKNKEEALLRQWINLQATGYANLRRGVIKGCEFLKSHIQSDGNIQFRDFIKLDNNQPSIEIPTTEIENYLDALIQSLVIREPINESALNIQYRLFLRALVHGWEENIDPNKKYKYNDIHTFAWLSKMARNWTSHANLLEPLNYKILAFLFMTNMRAMFKMPPEIQSFEEILLSCISTSKEIDDSLENRIKDMENHINNTLIALKIPEHKEDKNGNIILDKNDKVKIKNFGDKINAIHQKNTGYTKQHDFENFLLQYFWVNQKPNLDTLMANSDDFLPTLARHIYSHSFPEA